MDFGRDLGNGKLALLRGEVIKFIDLRDINNCIDKQLVNCLGSCQSEVFGHTANSHARSLKALTELVLKGFQDSFSNKLLEHDGW
ncbi:hypothetical protein XM38_008880 [Halomicronema hongdechloris C2206]|uniref:Uncharacterized protein n=1 Tax=Halomicronema hongdechloris C2206 TaxID=1641165 RepID=A0A1Z3HI48_9CYAN|nr:hypothetical protein XM38_008880 [Halomicronema hongdechloris C2206]